MFQKNLQNLNQKIRLASRNILGERGAAPVDSTFDRAKAQWLALEASVRVLLTEANNYKVEMKGIGDNGAEMTNKIAGMFENSIAAAPAGEGLIIGADPNDNHPYKDVAELMRQTQAKIQQEDIAVSAPTPHAHSSVLAPGLLLPRFLAPSLTGVPSLPARCVSTPSVTWRRV